MTPNLMRTRFGQILGYYQMAGGALGVLFSLYALSLIDLEDIFSVLIMILAILFFLYGVLCGYLLVRGSNLTVAFYLSAIHQALQIVTVIDDGFTYQFKSGFGFVCGFDLTADLLVGFKAMLSTFTLQWGMSTGKVFIGWDLVAISLIIRIVYELKETPSPNGQTLGGQDL